MSRPTFNKCLNEDAENLSPDEIKACTSKLLDPDKVEKRFDDTNKDVLTLVIREDKSGMFDFMGDRTSYKAVGSWKNPEGKRIKEDNTVFQTEFLDNSEEEIGERILNLLDQYNDKVVDESVLYAREHSIEGSTLKWADEGRTKVVDYS